MKRHPKYALSPEKIKEYLGYDPETGEFFWLKATNKRMVLGQPAGNLHSTGYVRIGLFGYKFFAHHIAWIITYGCWPTDVIDHINRDRADNRIVNLRLATRSENAFNAKVPVNNSTGVKGIGKVPGYDKYRVRLRKNNKFYCAGQYASIEEAAMVRQELEKRHFPNFARTED
jgi:hypothetical protein